MTEDLVGCKLDESAIIFDEEEEAGFVAGEKEFENDAGEEAPDDAANDNMVDVVDFEVENGQDGDKAQDHARQIKVEFEANDIKFWFSQLENEMVMASIKSQWILNAFIRNGF